MKKIMKNNVFKIILIAMLVLIILPSYSNAITTTRIINMDNVEEVIERIKAEARQAEEEGNNTYSGYLANYYNNIIRTSTAFKSIWGQKLSSDQETVEVEIDEKVWDYLITTLKLEALPPQDTTNSNLTDTEKNEIKKDVENWVLQNSSRADYEEALKNQREQTIQYDEKSEAKNEYRKKLYDEYIYQESDTKKQIEQQASNMTLEELQRKTKELNLKINTLRNMPSSYMENGKTRDELLNDLQREYNIYKSYEDSKPYEEAISQEYGSKDYTQSGGLGISGGSAEHTLDEVLSEANSFLSAGSSSESTLNGTNVIKASNTLYNILFSIGIFLSVAIGMYLGGKFMVSSVEEKAKVKEMLIPYIVGCVVIFGSFIIWKLIILLLNNI